MKRAMKLAAPLLAALILSACGGGAKKPPQSYVLEGNSLPSLNALVALEDGVEFEQTAGENDGTAYRYSKLSDVGKVVEEYTQVLESDYDCTVAADSGSGIAPDYSADSGQVLAAQKLADSEQMFLLTIQWEEDVCTITASLADQDTLSEQEVESMTLAQAVELIRRTPLSVLGLSGQSMDEYLILPLEGTVFLEGTPCILVNVYLAENHKFEESYLIDVVNMKLYRADPVSKEAVPLN